MTVKPPKCRFCGVEEWAHVCGPQASPARASKKAEVAGSSPAEIPPPKAKGSSKGAPQSGAPHMGGSCSSAGRAPPTSARVAQRIERRASNPKAAGSIPAASAKAASSNGKTSGFGPEKVDSTPTAAATEAVRAKNAQPAKPKTDRKEYLKLKARERRARERDAREAAKI